MLEVRHTQGSWRGVLGIAVSIALSIASPALGMMADFERPDVDQMEYDFCGENILYTEDNEAQVKEICLAVTPRIAVNNETIHILVVKYNNSEKKTYFLFGLRRERSSNLDMNGYIMTSAVVDKMGQTVKKSYLKRIFSQRDTLSPAYLKYVTGTTPDGYNFIVNGPSMGFSAQKKRGI